jgi:hypothetical protein
MGFCAHLHFGFADTQAFVGACLFESATKRFSANHTLVSGCIYLLLLLSITIGASALLVVLPIKYFSTSIALTPACFGTNKFRPAVVSLFQNSFCNRCQEFRIGIATTHRTIYSGFDIRMKSNTAYFTDMPTRIFEVAVARALLPLLIVFRRASH